MSSHELMQALENKGLTKQEVQVSLGVSRGYSNKEIGTRLHITEQTVKFHLTNIYKKMGIKSRAQLIVFSLPHLMHSDPFNTETDEENS